MINQRTPGCVNLGRYSKFEVKQRRTVSKESLKNLDVSHGYYEHTIKSFEAVQMSFMRSKCEVVKADEMRSGHSRK
jgi:hypothetical protein